MFVAIAGLQRSGTTLLADLCRGHSDMAITVELACLQGLGIPMSEYAIHLLSRAVLNRIQFIPTGLSAHEHLTRTRRSGLGAVLYTQTVRARNLLFVVDHLARLRLSREKPTSATAIEAAMRGAFPRARVVGDKWPDYIWQLDELTEQPNMRCVVIYRDVRDVAASTLVKVRTAWGTRVWAKSLNTAIKIADRWVYAITVMERYADACHPIKYEDLVHRPADVLAELGQWLDIDPDGFSAHIVDTSRIGKHQYGLTEEELANVMEIAGPTMARLGYTL